MHVMVELIQKVNNGHVDCPHINSQIMVGGAEGCGQTGGIKSGGNNVKIP